MKTTRTAVIVAMLALLLMGLVAPRHERPHAAITFNEVAAAAEKMDKGWGGYAITHFECAVLGVPTTACWLNGGVQHCMSAANGELVIVDTGLSTFGERTMSWQKDNCYSDATPRIRLTFDPPISGGQFFMRLHPDAVADRTTMICWVHLEDADDDSYGFRFSPPYAMGNNTIVGIGIDAYPHLSVCDFLDAEVDNIMVIP